MFFSRFVLDVLLSLLGILLFASLIAYLTGRLGELYKEQ